MVGSQRLSDLTESLIDRERSRFVLSTSKPHPGNRTALKVAGLCSAAISDCCRLHLGVVAKLESSKRTSECHAGRASAALAHLDRLSRGRLHLSARYYTADIYVAGCGRHLMEHRRLVCGSCACYSCGKRRGASAAGKDRSGMCLRSRESAAIDPTTNSHSDLDA